MNMKIVSTWIHSLFTKQTICMENSSKLTYETQYLYSETYSFCNKHKYINKLENVLGNIERPNCNLPVW